MSWARLVVSKVKNAKSHDPFLFPSSNHLTTDHVPRASIVVGYWHMIPRISHDRREETLEAKARWFQSLSLVERMNLFCEFTELVMQNNPEAAKVGRAQSSTERIRVLSIS